MFHGLTNKFLYAAYKISATFVDDIGNVKKGFGTCFFLQNKNGALCLVTNRHVLDFSYKKNDPEASKYLLKEVSIQGKLERTVDLLPVENILFSVLPNVIFHPNEKNDIACINQISLINAKDVTIDYFIPYYFIAQKRDFQERLTICDFLAFPGFPEWHDKRDHRPILRTGTISSDPRFDYSYKNEVEGACAAYEAFSFSGSSGSPVFAAQKGPKPGAGVNFPGYREPLFIGINAGHLKTKEMEHSGISYLYKSDAILDVIDS